MPGKFAVSFLSLIMMVVSISCSSPDPVTPSKDVTPSNEAVQTIESFSQSIGQILMSGSMYVDPLEFENSTTIDRSSDINIDITSLLASGCPDGCFSFRVVGVIGNTLKIELAIENPTDIQAYDVRLIYENTHGKTVLNPDSYTDMFKPWSIRPFTAFAKNNPSRAFPIGPSSTDTQILFLDFPQGGSGYVDFSIVASVPVQTGDTFEISGFEQHGELTPSGGSALLTLFAYDHQDDVSHVVMDTTAITGGLTFFEPVPGPQYLWSKEITNSQGVPSGSYNCPVIAISPNPQNINTFNYFTLTVNDEITNWNPIQEIHLSANGWYSVDPDLSFDSNGHAHVIWTEVENIGFTQWNHNIWYSNNVNGSWSQPYELSDAFQNVNDYIVSPAAIAINNVDQIAVVWTQELFGGDRPKLWWNFYDEQNGWTGQTQLFEFMSMEVMPQLYSDDGFFFLAFRHGHMSPDVMFSKWGSGEWTQPVPINDPIDMLYQIQLDGRNSIVAASRGTYYVAWSFYDMNPEGNWVIQYTESSDGGLTWSIDKTVVCDHLHMTSETPSFAMDIGGRVYALWQFGSNQIRWDKYELSEWWGHDMILYDQIGASFPSFDVFPTGYQHVCFVNSKLNPAPLLYIESIDSEIWTLPVTLSPGEGEAQMPSLKVWDNGKVGVIWKQHGGKYSNDILYREKIIR